MCSIDLYCHIVNIRLFPQAVSQALNFGVGSHLDVFLEGVDVNGLHFNDHFLYV